MNKPLFDVNITNYQQINEIEGGWLAEDYRKLLLEMEFDVDENTSEAELRELCVMCLQDKEISDAAEIVLKYRLGGKLSAGQIQNVAEEISQEKHWEQYADQSLHEQFFHVGNLMYAAFAAEMDEPDAVKLEVEITAKNQEAKEIVASPLHESLVARLLGDGMEEDAILRRLFDEQLGGKPFPEADSIIWKIKPKSSGDGKCLMEVISSCHWIDALVNVKRFESSAMSDDVIV